MSTTREHIRDESVIRRDIKKRLMPLVSLVDHTEDLYDRTVDALSNYPLPSAATKVCFLFITRLENDIRVCSLLSQSGYGLQALVNAATIVELVGAISYIGQDENRAKIWAQHTDKKHTYPPHVADGINATLDALGISDPSVRESWHKAYTFMCMAKHVNPLLSLHYGLRLLQTGESYVRGPDNSDQGILLSAESLYNAIFFGIAGIYVASTHCSDASVQKHLRTDAIETLKHLFDLESWFREVTRIRPSGPSAEDQREFDERLVKSLENATKALEEDTERIRSKTEILKKEAKRIKRETRNLRRSKR
ncbi:MAG: hypothetical protein JXA50_02605 [Deltaproteobacteria bacterium]|nr:hypothetical protein [Deltaproteobacteria bacterium]